MKTINQENQIAGFYQCFKQKNAFQHAIINFRNIYPHSTLHIYNDGGDTSLEEIAKPFNVKYVYCNKISNGVALIFDETKHLIEWVLRLRDAINKTKESYIMLIEDDVWVMKETNLSDLKYDLNGCNFNMGFSESINKYILEKNSNMNGEKIFFGGCGGCILRTSFYKKILDNIEKVKSLITKYNELGGFPASDRIISFLTYVSVEDGRNGTIGQFNGFTEKWYKDFDERMKNGSIEVLHQYKDLYDA